jgi:hypothetical protein
MRQKWWALLRIISRRIGFHRTVYKKLRFKIISKLFKGIDIRSYDEIQVNTLFIRLIYSSGVLELDHTYFPLSDAEREYLKDLLILRLPLKTIIETHYENNLDLTHQLTYCFIKPSVALYRDPHL